MAETKGHLAIVKEIVDSGLSLATTLETCRAIIVDDDIDYELDCIGREIQATASALQQLHTVSHSASTKLPEQERLDVFKDSGFKEIIELSERCAKVYETVIVLVSKAGTPPGQKAKAPAKSLDGLKLTINIIQEGMRGRWLRPRLEKCLEQLKWLKMNILCMIQLGGLAKLQLKNVSERAPGSFEEELVMRGAALRLRQKAADELENLKPKNFKEEDDFMGIFGEELPLSDDEDIVFGKVEEIVEVSESPEIPDEVPVEVAPPESMFDKIGETFDTIKPEVKSPASVSSSDTFVVIESEEPEEDKDTKTQGSTRSKTPLFDNPSKPVSTEEPTAVGTSPAVPITDEAPSAAEPSQGSVKVALSEENGSNVPDVELPLAAKSQKKLKIIPSWLRNIFSHQEINPEDKESETLEAFLLSDDLKDIVKIPFGHDCLTYGLKKMKKSSLTWDQYMSLSLEKRQSINRAVARAKRTDSRKRQCVSVGYQKGSGENRMILFFSLGESVEPVHLKDAVGRKFDFEYERCRTWKQMHALICEAFKHVSLIGPHVADAHYDLLGNKKGDILLPSQFEASIKPGLEISMHMWPMDDFPLSPPRIAPPPPRPGPPPPPPGGWGPPPGPPPRPSFPPPPMIVVHPRPLSSSDVDSIYADSDIDDGPEDKGIEIDYKHELEKSKLTMGELLARFTYALDTVDEQMTSIFAGIGDSDTSSSYSSSLVDA